jgi:hypothetical protein
MNQFGWEFYEERRSELLRNAQVANLRKIALQERRARQRAWLMKIVRYVLDRLRKTQDAGYNQPLETGVCPVSIKQAEQP